MSSEDVTVEQARGKLGDLVIAAMRGESTVITRYGKPAALITPHKEPAMVNLDNYPIADTYHLRALKLLNSTKRDLDELMELMVEGDVDLTDPTFIALAALQTDIAQKAALVARAMPDSHATDLD